jgi:hypothetical protein
MVGADEQLLRNAVELRLAVDGQVVLGVLAAQQALFGGLDRRQHRRLAAGILVDADAQVDLLRMRVGLEGFGQTQNRVRRGRLDLLEHVGCLGFR